MAASAPSQRSSDLVVDQAAALVAEGSAALAKSVLAVAAAQADGSRAELATLERATALVGASAAELAGGVADVAAFYDAHAAATAALRPALDAIRELDGVVAKLEESAKTLDGQTKQLEVAIAEMLNA